MASLRTIFKDIFTPGWKDVKKAKQMQEQALAQEQADKLRIQEETARVNALNQGYLQRYLNQLQGLPDVAYSQGLGRLQRGVLGNQSELMRAMSAQGATQGVDLRALANQQSQMARGTSALQGQLVLDRANALGQMYSTGAQASQTALGNVAKAWNPAVSPYLMKYASGLGVSGQQANQDRYELLTRLITSGFGG